MMTKLVAITIGHRSN